MSLPLMIAVTLAFLFAFAATSILGAIAIWVLRSVTLAREPAFAGFCFTLGSAMADGKPNWTSDQRAEQLAVLTGTILGLWLLWRWRVRPERTDTRLQQ